MSKDRKTVDIARQVIDDEVEALIGLKDYIDENFEEIINVVCECKGRLIFTGIGKSGHICKKYLQLYQALEQALSLCTPLKLFMEI